jgi:hypothetical protein
MFEASVDGKPYDNDKWGAYYRPYGLDAPAGAEKPVTETSTITVSAKSAPVVEDEEVETKASEPVVVPKSTSSDKAQDILAMIRARQQKA